MNRLVQLFALNLHNTILFERERKKKKDIAQKKKKIDDNSIHTYIHVHVHKCRKKLDFVCTKKMLYVRKGDVYSLHGMGVYYR